jgi:hypothetical protein
MAARIGLSTGKEWVVEGTADEVADFMMHSTNPFSVESSGRESSSSASTSPTSKISQQASTSSVESPAFRDPRPMV